MLQLILYNLWAPGMQSASLLRPCSLHSFFTNFVHVYRWPDNRYLCRIKNREFLTSKKRWLLLYTFVTSNRELKYCYFYYYWVVLRHFYSITKSSEISLKLELKIPEKGDKWPTI